MRTQRIFLFLLSIFTGSFAASLHAASVIQFSATSYTVAENAGQATLAVQRTNDLETPVSVDFATSDGTATNGLKYTGVSGTLAFGVNETNKTIVVPILNDSLVGGIKSFRVILNNPAGGALLGTRTNVSVLITDNDVGLQFQFSTAGVSEDASVVHMDVVRGDDGANAVTVDFATADGTATNGLKYTAVSGTLSFEAGETNKVVTVPILNNGLVDGPKTFRVILSNPNGGAVLGTRSNVLISITDNDSPLKVEFISYEAREGEADVVIGVLRGDDSNEAVTVDYGTASLTAIADSDYTETTGTLTFSSGEKLKLVSIPILNDAMKEPNETFRFTLANAVGASLGTQNSATIALKDNDFGVEFVTTQHFIHEDEGVLRVTVRRGNDRALGPFTVDYATKDGTALGGQDYVATNGTLAFAVGELSQSFQVPVISDGLLEADQSFRLVLSHVTGDAGLGAATNLTVILCDATGQTPHGFAGVHRDPDGVVKLTFTAGVSQRFQPFFDLYPVEVSTNLVDWESLTLLQRTNSTTNELTFIHPAAGAAPKRFYRTPTNHFTAAYPKPSGPYPVGRIDRLVTDPTRRNRRGMSTNGAFAISVWYPAAPLAGQRPARWFEEVVARDTSTTSIWSTYNVSQWLDRLPHLCNYAFSDAPLAEVSGPLPVVLYSPGWSADRREDAEKLEGLASYGYVVVSVDHDDAFDTVWPNGFYHSRTDAPTTEEDFKNRVRDLVVILEELTDWNQHDARFAGKLGLATFGAMGFSWGGPTVVELARQDARCKALVLLDPGGTAVSLQGFSTVSLTMHNSGENEQSVFAASKTNAYWFQISNTDHASLANHLLYSGKPLASNREAERAIDAYAFSFFNKWLKGQDDHLHEAASPNFPRVINFRKK